MATFSETNEASVDKGLYAEDEIRLYVGGTAIPGITVAHGDCLEVMAGLEDNSIDAVVTDPPYGLSNTSREKVTETVTHWMSGDRTFIPKGTGFMSRPWDAFVPPVAVWDQVLRVLKPGGFALVFAGSRTQDLMALALRLAGFDIQDSIAWIYGSGFPKSLNVTEAVEHYQQHGPAGLELNGQEIRPGVYEVTAFLRTARERAGWTNRQIDALFGTNGMSGHWTTSASQPAVPSVRQWAILKEHLGFGDDLDELVEKLASTERPEDWGVGATDDRTFLDTLKRDPEAVGIRGWGTALKPAFEPIVVARKPLEGSYAANIMQYGTGALNIAECQIGAEGGHMVPKDSAKGPDRAVYGGGLNNREWGPAVPGLGRWPANLVLDESQAAELDKQSGYQKDGVAVRHRGVKAGMYGPDLAEGTPDMGYGSGGGASRYFYVPKASPEERISYSKSGNTVGASIASNRCAKCGKADLSGSRCECLEPEWIPRGSNDVVSHPTVKPLALMRWLIRLVTPKGGVVLDPFAGSGTTAEAALREGFRCIAIEREADYLPLIEERLKRGADPVMYAAKKKQPDLVDLFEGLDI
jgi:DNA modification methylase